MQNIQVSYADKIRALKQNRYFCDLDEPILDNLARGAWLHQYERGEAICWQGEPGAALFILQSGSAKLFKLSPKGRELIIRLLEAGNSFNEVPVFDGGTNPVNVAALEVSDVWAVDAGVIRQAMAEHPVMAQAVIQNLSLNLRSLVSIVEELSFCQVTNRLARLISRISPEQLAEQRPTQDQLAAQLGTVREVVTRSMRELERSGAIRVERRQIRVVDEMVLRDWAQAAIGE